jgi:phosphatidylglycerol:prolipoprotein diacylglycerol transferase
MVVLVFMAVFAVIFTEGRRLGVPLKHMYWMFAIVLMVGLILGKITDILGRPAVYAAHPERIVSLAGMRVAGVFPGALLVKLFYSWRARLSFWKVSDILAPGEALGSTMFRVGCFLNGCCYGLECPVPWLAVTYTGQHSLAPLQVPLYPVQFFGAVCGLVIFSILWALRKKLQPEGSIFLLFYILYAASDFVIRLFRQPDAVIADIQIQQIVNIIMLIVAIPLYIMRRKQYLRSVGP